MAARAQVFLLFLSNLALNNAFNLDTHVPIVKEGRGDAYFGYSVAQHQSYRHQTGTADHVLLVGAPRDNVTDPSAPSQVRNLKSPGVIYTCPVSSFKDDCEAVEIDREVPRSGEVKDGQWLGVTVESQGTEDGKAVACAHRYRMSGPGYDHGPGLCIVMSNELDEDVFLEPCSGKPKADGHGQYGLCQAGTSLAVSGDGDVLIGTPGPYNWRGSIFKNIIRDSLTEFPQWYQSPVEDPLDEDDPRPDPATGYYSYLGMSSKIGNILGQKTYVTGAPRSNKAGEVLLFAQGTDWLTIKDEHRLLGEQFGSGFGYDVAVVDLNADQKDDLVVCAPFFHEPGVGGAIYVYINGPEGITADTKPMVIKSRKMKESECKTLDCTNARFGAAIANIGDVDRDGFNDIAVGAPYEGTGVVYIFRGYEKGLRSPFSQRIAASDLLSARPLASFGSSISGGTDMDKNGYPDIVVGAFGSDKALILRARPVVNIETVVQNYPEKINPSETQCASDGKPNICFNLRVCFQFTAEPTDRFTGKIDVDYKVEAEPGQIKPRASFKSALPRQPHVLERSMKLHEQANNQFKCREHLVYIDRNNKDFLNPIFFELTYKLKDQGVPTMSPGQQLPDINSYPVLNEQAAKQDLGVHFIKNCGQDNVCQSNLVVYGNLQLDLDETGVPLLRVGEQDEVRLAVRVKNKGEDAHEAELTVMLPKALPFLNSEPRIGCDFKVLDDDEEFNKIVCPVGNPMKRDDELKVYFRLNAKDVTAAQRIVNIHLNVNTTSTETEEENNRDVLPVRILIETDMIVRGQSHPTDVFYGGKVLGESAIKYEDQIGPMIVHSYVVVNGGKGTVSSSEVMINWPYEVENGLDQGKHLLYLMEAPKIDKPGKCDIDPRMINPLKIQSRAGDTIDQVLPVLSSDENNNPEYKSRQKREVTAETRRVAGKDLRIIYMDCDGGGAKCFSFKCTVGAMKSGESIAIHLRARLWNHTFVEDYRKVDEVWVSSSAEIVTDPKLNIKQTNTGNDKAVATTKAKPDIRIREPDGVPLWIIILAVIGGLILLIVLIILLWKCGFFKRKKPEDLHVAEKKKMYYDEDYS